MTALPVRLRSARREDLDAIVALDRATELAPHWPVAVYAAILDAIWEEGSCLRCLIVAEHFAMERDAYSSLVVGFAVGLVHGARPAGNVGPRIAELEDVVVAASCRRAGVGQALCSAVLDWCRSQGATEVALEVRTGNVGAIALYRRLGFEQVGCRPGYYCDPDEGAAMMRWRCS